MIKRILYFFTCVLILLFQFRNNIYAAGINDPTIPAPTNVKLDNSGTVEWDADDNFSYKSFQISLLKRADLNDNGTIVYEYKTSGSTKTAAGEDRSYNLIIGSVGYYRVRVRSVNLSGNYSNWTESTVDIPITEDDTSTPALNYGTSVSPMAGGPGVYTNTTGGYSSIIAPAGLVNNISNNQIDNSPRYSQVLSPGANEAAMSNQNQTNVLGPGYTNQSTNISGINTNPITNANNINTNPITNANNINTNPITNANNINTNPITNNTQGSVYGPGLPNNSQGINTNPITNANNFRSNGGSSGIYAIPAQTITGSNTPTAGGNNVNQGSGSEIEIGWHVDGGGRYFYQGNGVYLKNTWAEIGGHFYRFDETGHAVINSWYADPTTKNKYLLDGEGKMLLGWQKKDGKWYYLNPNRGTSYGVMYFNSVLTIDGKIYAFNAEGVMVENAWYNGYYYGSDGARV